MKKVLGMIVGGGKGRRKTYIHVDEMCQRKHEYDAPDRMKWKRTHVVLTLSNGILVETRIGQALGRGARKDAESVPAQRDSIRSISYKFNENLTLQCD